MVNTKRYDPTITRFQKHTKNFVSGKTQKGHLGEKEESGDVTKEEGVLVKVIKKDIYGKGWEVKIGEKTVMCNYGDNIVYLPDCTVSDQYYIPKKECRVEVSMDKRTKINTITRINDPDKQPISMVGNTVKIKSSGSVALEMGNRITSILGDRLSVQGDVVVDTSEKEDLPDKISVTDLYKRIEVLESKLSDNNDS